MFRDVPRKTGVIANMHRHGNSLCSTTNISMLAMCTRPHKSFVARSFFAVPKFL